MRKLIITVTKTKCDNANNTIVCDAVRPVDWLFDGGVSRRHQLNQYNSNFSHRGYTSDETYARSALLNRRIHKYLHITSVKERSQVK